MYGPELETRIELLGFRVARAAFLAATAWVFLTIWLAWAALRVMHRTRWPSWTYRPANYAFWLLTETYLPILGLLTLVWAGLVFAPVGRWRWAVGAVTTVLALTWVFHLPGVRE